MKKFKKLFCIALACVVLVAACPVAFAETGVVAMPEEVVEIMAGYFVEDMVNSGLETKWTATTEVADSTPLYDEDGAVTAYSFELTDNGTYKGYVVVAVYPDMENQILEFSDSARPLYEALSLDASDKVVYTGNLEYFKDSGTATVETTGGLTIDKSDLVSAVKEVRSSEFLPPMTRGAEYITDPIAYANSHYEGPFKAHEWKNTYEDYCNFNTMYDFKLMQSQPTGQYTYYPNCCVATALTNLLEMRGEKEGIHSITRYPAVTLFKIIHETIGMQNGYYASTQGVPAELVSPYIQHVLDYFLTDYSYYVLVPTYSNIKSRIDNEEPFLLDLLSHDTYATGYSDHAVAAYAYTRLKSETTGYFKSFVKVADGKVHAGRYIDVATIQTSTNAMLYGFS